MPHQYVKTKHTITFIVDLNCLRDDPFTRNTVSGRAKYPGHKILFNLSATTFTKRYATMTVMVSATSEARKREMSQRSLVSEDSTIVLSVEDLDTSSTDDGTAEGNLFPAQYHASDASLLLEKSLTFEDAAMSPEQLPIASRSLWDMSVNSSQFDKSLTFSDYYGDEQDQQSHNTPKARQGLQHQNLGSLQEFPSSHGYEKDFESGELLLEMSTGTLSTDAGASFEEELSDGTVEQNAPIPPRLPSQSSAPAPQKFPSRVASPVLGNETPQGPLPVSKRARFAAIKPMSVARMELTMDTVIKAHEGPNSFSQKNRRMSFGYVLRQEFEKAAPACVIVQGCLERMDEWDPKPFAEGTVSSKPSKIKSILKKIKKRLSITGGRRRSFLGTKEVQANSPKKPGRRGSFQKASWTIPQRDCSSHSQNCSKRRGSLLGNMARRFSNDGSAPWSPTKPTRQTSQDAAQRKGSFLGNIARRFSNGGNASCTNTPPRKPGRRSSQNGVERRGSFLGMRRRLSTGGRWFSNGDSTECIRSMPKMPGRRCSQNVFVSITHRLSNCHSSVDDKTNIGDSSITEESIFSPASAREQIVSMQSPRKPQRRAFYSEVHVPIPRPELYTDSSLTLDDGTPTREPPCTTVVIEF